MNRITRVLCAGVLALALSAGIALAQDSTSTAAPAAKPAATAKHHKMSKKHHKMSKKSKKAAAASSTESTGK